MVKSCGCQDDCGCQCGNLPYTMTVTLSGFVDKTHVDGCSLSFSSDFGSGAAGIVTSPGGCSGNADSACSQRTPDEPGVFTLYCDEPNYDASDRGPITAVTLTDGGSCYAVRGETDGDPPTVANVTVTACGGGSDAVIKASIDDDPDSETFGRITGLTITDGGSDYLAWQHIVVDATKINRSFVLRAENPKPLVALCVKSCFGVNAAINLETTFRDQSDDTCPCAVVEDGEYVVYRDWDGQPTPIPRITLTAGGTGYAILGRAEPSLTVSSYPDSGGSGATFTPAYDQIDDECGLPCWVLSSVSVVGGTGFANNEPLLITTADVTVEPASAAVLVDENGVVVGVAVTSGGRYYYEGAELPPLVSDAQVVVDQASGSNGQDASIDLVIDTDPDSVTFGSITSATLTNPGSGYTLLGGSCSYLGGCNAAACTDLLETVRLTFASGREPRVEVIGFTAKGESEIIDCRSIGSLELSGRVAATIESGGAWQTGGTLCCGPKTSPYFSPDQDRENCGLYEGYTLTFNGEPGPSVPVAGPFTWDDGQCDFTLVLSGVEILPQVTSGGCGQCLFYLSFDNNTKIVQFPVRECGELSYTLRVSSACIEEALAGCRELPGSNVPETFEDVDIAVAISNVCNIPECLSNPFP